MACQPLPDERLQSRANPVGNERAGPAFTEGSMTPAVPLPTRTAAIRT